MLRVRRGNVLRGSNLACCYVHVRGWLQFERVYVSWLRRDCGVVHDL